MLIAFDYFFTFLHLLIILFNLFGWLHPKLLKLHLIFVTLTLACWLILGIWYGIGYCPVTDWQWEVKEQLGERDLPASFIKYYLDKVSGQSFDPAMIDWLTATGFGIAIAASLTRNFRVYRKKRRAAQQPPSVF